MATSVYPFPTDPQKKERPILSTLCHIPSHALLIRLPGFEANWTKWKALESTGNEDELFQKQRTAQILAIIFSCMLIENINKVVSEAIKEKRGFIISKKLTRTTWVLNGSFSKIHLVGLKRHHYFWKQHWPGFSFEPNHRFWGDLGKENHCLSCVGAFASLGVPLVNNKVHWILWAPCSQSVLTVRLEPEHHPRTCMNPLYIFPLPPVKGLFIPAYRWPPDFPTGWSELRNKDRQTHTTARLKGTPMMSVHWLLTNVIPFLWSIMYIQKRPFLVYIRVLTDVWPV